MINNKYSNKAKFIIEVKMEVTGTNFIEEIIDNDLATGKHDEIVTRFPPEPNGYLHIGHAKAICINFGIKEKYHGKCNLRFDDTNPAKEDVEYVNSIKDDIEWLGFKWDNLYYGSDYFDKMYECAELLITKGLAYVCDLSAEEIKNTRGTLTEAGVNSPYRDRTVEENLKLFREMKAGKYADGEKVLRAKIDMASPNINMRDPVIYRIVHVPHHRTGDKWVIYPMYDFAHPLEDAIEGITHSICTLEFEAHRPLYDWVVNNCDFVKKPRQIEFARLNITRTIMSKRYLKSLVDNGTVTGWDDPRMPTISGLRKRGYTPSAIRDFCSRIGVAKANSEVESSLLEHCVREELNETANRGMAVLKPLKVIVDNYEGEETFVVTNNPNDESAGTHEITFSNELYIDEDDFSLNPPPKYKRLMPGGKVRLRGAYIVEYKGVDEDENGNVVAVHVDYIPDSQSGGSRAKEKAKGVIQYVDAKTCKDATIRMYDYLLLDGEGDFNNRINEKTIEVFNGKVEPYLVQKPYTRFQFMRVGYFMVADESTEDNLIFNNIVNLKDSFNSKK